MNASIHKRSILAILLFVSGAAYASEPAIAVNTDGLPPYLAAKVVMKAQEGMNELRRFVWRTRMIYGLELRTLLRG